MRKIAVVDDCLIVRAMVKFMIPKSEWEVHCYKDPQDLVNEIDRENWDAIITDYDMPGLSGYELVRISKRFAPTTRVIMITANCKVIKTHPDIKNWVEDLIFKPFSRLALLKALHTLN